MYVNCMGFVRAHLWVLRHVGIRDSLMRTEKDRGVDNEITAFN